MFDEWCVECEQLGITAYNGFITMIRNWEPQIFAYFDFTGDDRTNAQTESLNRAIRNVARDGRVTHSKTSAPRWFSIRSLRAALDSTLMPSMTEHSKSPDRGGQGFLLR